MYLHEHEIPRQDEQVFSKLLGGGFNKQKSNLLMIEVLSRDTADALLGAVERDGGDSEGMEAEQSRNGFPDRHANLGIGSARGGIVLIMSRNKWLAIWEVIDWRACPN